MSRNPKRLKMFKNVKISIVNVTGRTSHELGSCNFLQDKKLCNAMTNTIIRIFRKENETMPTTWMISHDIVIYIAQMISKVQLTYKKIEIVKNNLIISCIHTSNEF